MLISCNTLNSLRHHAAALSILTDTGYLLKFNVVSALSFEEMSTRRKSLRKERIDREERVLRIMKKQRSGKKSNNHAPPFYQPHSRHRCYQGGGPEVGSRPQTPGEGLQHLPIPLLLAHLMYEWISVISP